MLKKIKFGLIGCGSIGKKHIAVIDQNSNAMLQHFCDIDQRKCEEMAALYGDISWSVNYKELFKSDLDVVNIASPHYLHSQMAIDALNAGFHVLVEKPMALNRKECEKMLAAAELNNKKLWVVKQNRFNVPVVMANNAISEGRLGKILYLKCDIMWNRYQGYYDESNWRGKLEKEGGALYTQASHFIDLMIWWCGEVTGVKGYTKLINHQIEFEDLGSVNLEFSEGALGSLNWTTCVYDKNFEGSITIIAEKGTIKIGGKYLNKIEYWNVEGLPLDETKEYTDKPNSYDKYQGTSSNHHRVIDSVIQHLNDKPSEMLTGFEGMKTVVAIEDIYKAVRGRNR